MPRLRQRKICSRLATAIAGILLATWWPNGATSTSVQDASAKPPAAATLYSQASRSVFELMATSFR